MDQMRKSMDRIRRSIRQSFRRSKKTPSTALSTGGAEANSTQPPQWHNDEVAVRAGNCSFQVKYLGCIEVFESRGMQICEDALKQLRNTGRKTQRAVLHISGDGLRVVDATSSQLIVDQTIEKVSFCAPDRNHDRGFSYICRDGATRRWLCHGFIAVRESGERLSHAVGCAFQICLEKKQKRDREVAASSTPTSSQVETASVHHHPLQSVVPGPPRSSSALPLTNHATASPSSASSFIRQSSTRTSSIADRMKDPQEYKAASPPPPPVFAVVNPYSRDRPHATPQMILRQQSLRVFSTLNNSATPFKRNLSLQGRDEPETGGVVKWKQLSVDSATMPSQAVHQRGYSTQQSGLINAANSNVPTWEDGTPILDAEDSFAEEPEEFTNEVSRLCQQMSFDLSMMSNNPTPFDNGHHYASPSNGPVSSGYSIPKSMSTPFSPEKQRPESAREARARFAERSPFSRMVHPPPSSLANGDIAHYNSSSTVIPQKNGGVVWSESQVPASSDPFNTDNVNWVNLSRNGQQGSTNPFVV